MAKEDRKNCPLSRLVIIILFLILIAVFPADAGINFNYTNSTHRNYTITDAVLNSIPPDFIRLVGGNIEMPSITLTFAINKTLTSGDRTLVLNATRFGPATTTLPNQKVYIIGQDGTASIKYIVDASNSFANAAVNVSTFRQVSNNVPFFSDFSLAVLNFNDLKNTWNDDAKVLDGFITALDETNRINETNITLNPGGKSGRPISQNLGPGNYLIMVTRGTDPKEIITFNNIQVLPFSSSINIGDGSGNAPQGMDLQVSISLPSSAPAENYTYITSIINRSDYADNLGNINITWSSGTLAQATRVNGTVLNNANALTDIIPRSSIARITTNSGSVNLALNTTALPPGSYFVHTVVFNSTNFSVAFDQSPVTLAVAKTTLITSLNDTGYANATLNIPTPDVNIIVTIPNGTRATLSDGTTPISNITTYSVASFNSTLETAASGSNLRFLGRNLTLLPEGAKFTPYILVRFNYSNADVPAGVSSLKAYWYNSSRNSWEELVTNSAGTNTDGSKYIEARVPHFSTFALLGSVTTIVPSGGGGGSTGGSGVITDEPFENIEKVERYDESLIAGKPVTYTFTDPEHGVYEVAVTGKANEDDITLRIEALKATSKLVAVPASGVVYKNLNILIGTKNIKEAFVRFRVENSWLSSNDLAGGDIKLLKWNGSKWIQLDTAELRKDASYTYFEARTDTFSHFAISGIKTEAVATVTPAITQPGISPTVTGISAVTGVPAGKGLQVNLVLIAVLIALIAIVVVLYIKRK